MTRLLLAPDGPRLIDFGIARGAADSRLTRTGMALGTPQFMAPEQIQGDRETGAAADLFALAGVLLYAMTGQYPFGEGSAVTLLYRIVHEAPRLEPVPPDLRPLLAACLDKDPGNRPTAVEVGRQLGRLLDPGRLPDQGRLVDPERTVKVATGRGEAATVVPRHSMATADTPTDHLVSGSALPTDHLGPASALPTDRHPPASALPTESVASATQSASAVPYPFGPSTPAGPPATEATAVPHTEQAANRWRKPAAIGASVAAGVTALVLALTLGSGDSGSHSSAGAGRVVDEIPDPVAGSSLAAGTGVVLPSGSTTGGATPSPNPGSSGRSPAAAGGPTGTPADGSSPTTTAGQTGATGSPGPTAAGSKPGGPASGTTGTTATSQPKGSSSGPASHTSAPPASSAGPTTAPSSSAGSGSGVPTRVSPDSTARIIQSAYDSKCVTAAAEADGSKWYVSGSCDGAPAQWKVWHGTSTSAGLPTWQFESTSYPGYCMSAAWTSSSQNWQLVPCSAGDEWQWWAASEASGSTMLNLWHDTTHCLVNNQGIDSEKCANNPDNLPSVYFYWKIK